MSVFQLEDCGLSCMKRGLSWAEGSSRWILTTHCSSTEFNTVQPIKPVRTWWHPASGLSRLKVHVMVNLQHQVVGWNLSSWSLSYSKVPKCYIMQKTILFTVACWGWIEMSPSLREVATLSAGIAANTSVSFNRWQHGEQTVAGWVLSFVFFVLCADTTTHPDAL